MPTSGDSQTRHPAAESTQHAGRHVSLSPRERGLSLLLFVLAANAALLAIHRYPGYPRLLFFRLGFPWVAAQLSLVALWGALGRTAGIVRLQAMLVAPVAVALCTSSESAFDAFMSMSLLSQAPSDPSVVDLSLLFLTLTFLVCFPFALMRLSGLLALEDTNEPEPHNATTATQFSLRQLFTFTATLAFLLGVATLGSSHNWNEMTREWFRAAMPIAWVSLTAAATVWLVLSRSWFIYRVALATAALLMACSGGLWIVLFTRMLSTARSFYFENWMIMLAIKTVLLILLLLIVRSWGYRLQFVRPSSN